MWLYHREMTPNDADGMANSVDPDQTAPRGSWSALFAQAQLSENLGSLRGGGGTYNINENVEDYNRLWSYIFTFLFILRDNNEDENGVSSRKLLRIKVTPDLHLTYSKNGENLGLVLKMKNIACISILLTKHVKYTYLYLFKFVFYSIVAFKAN